MIIFVVVWFSVKKKGKNLRYLSIVIHIIIVVVVVVIVVVAKYYMLHTILFSTIIF